MDLELVSFKICPFAQHSVIGSFAELYIGHIQKLRGYAASRYN